MTVAAGGIGAAVVLGLGARWATGHGQSHTDAIRASLHGGHAKNVIFFLGDGIGTQEITAARYYRHGAAGRMNVDRLPFTGFRTTWSIKPAAGWRDSPTARRMSQMLTSLVGSYPQPEWLIDREKLRSRLPPRVRARDLWRIDPAYLRDAQDAAVLMAVRDQHDAGLDIITDGEMRRESYSNYFVAGLEGVDIDEPGSVLDRSGNPMPAPRVTGPIRRRAAVEVRDVRFLRAATDKRIKVTVPGPFTMAAQADNQFYEHPRDVAFAFADAVREEIGELFAAGADVVQLDEPWMESRADAARDYGLETLHRALDGITGTTALHICFGYPLFVPDHARTYRYLPELAAAPVDQISIETAQASLDLEVLARLTGKTVILGVIALDSPEVESAATVAERIRRALPHKPAGELIAAPDCGMKYLPREAAFAKLQSLVAGAARV